MRKTISLITFLVFALTIFTQASWAQQTSEDAQAGSAQATAPGTRASQRAQHREQMQAMCKQHMDAMKAQVDKLHASLDQMKSNVTNISNADEKARWQANVDMWQILVDHHDQMLKHMQDAQASGMGCGMMEGMGGPGMMRHHGMGGMGAPAGPPPK
ncbi:MAG TPA: hypothetical protein VFI95_04545 [Terriglobales bacterium]|nr:hypothetical protein [Terriglobales bacterium]